MDKEILRQKFYDNNIPYDDIDPEMINIIDVLNFQLGYKTEFCCYGHNENSFTKIIFNSEISDEKIYELIKYIHEWYGNPKIQIYGRFNKWARILKYEITTYNIDNSFDIHFNKNEELKTNWVWEGIYSGHKDLINKKREYMSKFLECLRDFK